MNDDLPQPNFMPIPPRGHGRGRASMFPWATMPIGAHIAVTPEFAVRAKASASQYKLNHIGEFNYTTRKQPDGGIFIWRIAPRT